MSYPGDWEYSNLLGDLAMYRNRIAQLEAENKKLTKERDDAVAWDAYSKREIAALREQVAKMPVLMGYATTSTVEDIRLRCMKDGPTLTFSRALYMQRNTPTPPQEQGE
jgi:hypothetical protein